MDLGVCLREIDKEIEIDGDRDRDRDTAEKKMNGKKI